MILRIILVCGAVLLLATGCGSASAGGGSALDVVAAENAYGDIARQIGGAHVAVTSILSDPSADPHLYAPGTRSGLAVANARLVIQNGVGYDAFMTKLEDASPSSRRRVVTIADVLDVHGKDANPHLWYDVPKLPAVASAIATGPRARRPGARCRVSHRAAPLRVAPVAAAARGRADPDVVRGDADRLHGARARVPRRRRRAAERRARRVHARDRERHRADAAGARRDARAHDAEEDRRSPLQQPGRVADHAAASATPRRTRGSPSSA